MQPTTKLIKLAHQFGFDFMFKKVIFLFVIEYDLVLGCVYINKTSKHMYKVFQPVIRLRVQMPDIFFYRTRGAVDILQTADLHHHLALF